MVGLPLPLPLPQGTSKLRLLPLIVVPVVVPVVIGVVAEEVVVAVVAAPSAVATPKLDAVRQQLETLSLKLLHRQSRLLHRQSRLCSDLDLLVLHGVTSSVAFLLGRLLHLWLIRSLASGSPPFLLPSTSDYAKCPT